MRYKSISPWKNDPLQEDIRSPNAKFKTMIIKKMPKIVMCELASIMHGVVVPNRNYKRMKARED